MKLLNILFACISCILASAAANPVSASQLARRGSSEPAFPFNFEYLFTAELKYGEPFTDTVRTVQVPGGVRYVTPIVGGTVNGPAANATVAGGVGFPEYYPNITGYERAGISLYGTFDDGSPFFASEQGIGTNVSRTTRLFIDTANDIYLNITQGYVLAHVIPGKDFQSVTLQAYLVLDAMSSSLSR